MGSGSISPGRYQPAKRAPLDDRYIRQLVLSQRKHLFISGAHAAAATAERIGIVCTGALARGVQPWVARAFRMRFLVALSRPATGAHAGVCCAAAALLVCTACNLSSPIITGAQELPLCWDAASKDSKQSSTSVHWPQALWNTSTAADQQALDLGPLFRPVFLAHRPKCERGPH